MVGGSDINRKAFDRESYSATFRMTENMGL